MQCSKNMSFEANNKRAIASNVRMTESIPCKNIQKGIFPVNILLNCQFPRNINSYFSLHKMPFSEILYNIKKRVWNFPLGFFFYCHWRIPKQSFLRIMNFWVFPVVSNVHLYPFIVLFITSQEDVQITKTSLILRLLYHTEWWKNGQKWVEQ